MPNFTENDTIASAQISLEKTWKKAKVEWVLKEKIYFRPKEQVLWRVLDPIEVEDLIHLLIKFQDYRVDKKEFKHQEK